MYSSRNYEYCTVFYFTYCSLVKFITVYRCPEFVRGEALNQIYANAKIVVGDTLNLDFKYPWYSSDRLFEVTGRGGFMIYPDIEGLDTFFERDKEIVFYTQDEIQKHQKKPPKRF